MEAAGERGGAKQQRTSESESKADNSKAGSRQSAGTLQKAPAASQSKSRLPASPPAGIINRALITGIL